jgi:hypothetical protein
MCSAASMCLLCSASAQGSCCSHMRAVAAVCACPAVLVRTYALRQQLLYLRRSCITSHATAAPVKHTCDCTPHERTCNRTPHSQTCNCTLNSNHRASQPPTHHPHQARWSVHAPHSRHRWGPRGWCLLRCCCCCRCCCLGLFAGRLILCGSSHKTHIFMFSGERIHL